MLFFRRSAIVYSCSEPLWETTLTDGPIMSWTGSRCDESGSEAKQVEVNLQGSHWRMIAEATRCSVWSDQPLKSHKAEKA